ncbi:MAG: GTPase HflX [Candidatus Riflebacteria bacterium]|nr:GTPase HflX [Candidatus Riflebacteria bacterium]
MTEIKGTVVIIAVQTPEQTDEEIQANLDELRELLRTAAYSVVSSIVQKRPRFDRVSYFGDGKIQELKRFVEEADVDHIVADDELSALQVRKLEEGTETTVSDRTGVILEIFANVASSREGKMQVELARMQYQLLRLAGGYSALSRQRGGIGLKGPGETKIEADRRVLKFKIVRLKRELEKVVENRRLLRQKRIENLAPLFALVGYTNAGKSTLLNSLCGSEVTVNDGLFTTLDPTARRVNLPSGRFCVLSDTVGFIKKLPHNLVKAFRATLEDVINSQVVILVSDISSSDTENRIAVVRDVLLQIEALEKEIILVFNKTDKSAPETINIFKTKYPEGIYISAKEKIGLGDLLFKFDEIMKREYQLVELLIPGNSPICKQILSIGIVKSQEWSENGVKISVELPRKILSMVSSFRIDNQS